MAKPNAMDSDLRHAFAPVSCLNPQINDILDPTTEGVLPVQAFPHANTQRARTFPASAP